MGLLSTKVDEDARGARTHACRAETRLGVGRTSTRVSMLHASMRAPRLQGSDTRVALWIRVPGSASRRPRRSFRRLPHAFQLHAAHAFFQAVRR